MPLARVEKIAIESNCFFILDSGWVEIN